MVPIFWATLTKAKETYHITTFAQYHCDCCLSQQYNDNIISHSQTVTSYPMFTADCDIVISTALIIVADCVPNDVDAIVLCYELPNRINNNYNTLLYCTEFR